MSDVHLHFCPDNCKYIPDDSVDFKFLINNSNCHIYYRSSKQKPETESPYWNLLFAKVSPNKSGPCVGCSFNCHQKKTHMLENGCSQPIGIEYFRKLQLTFSSFATIHLEDLMVKLSLSSDEVLNLINLFLRILFERFDHEIDYMFQIF